MAQNTYSDLAFTVTPEALYQKSEEVQTAINSMRNEFDSIKSIMSRTSSYWQGEAADTYRKNYTNYEPDIQEIFARLSEHVSDLNNIAGQYVEAENKAQSIAETLPDAVIE